MRKPSKSGFVFILRWKLIELKGVWIGKRSKNGRNTCKIKKKPFCPFFLINILELISLVVIIDSEMKLLKVSNFFVGNAHIQFKVCVINASILKVFKSTFLKKKTKHFKIFVNFYQFFIKLWPRVEVKQYNQKLYVFYKQFF